MNKAPAAAPLRELPPSTADRHRPRERQNEPQKLHTSSLWFSVQRDVRGCVADTAQSTAWLLLLLPETFLLRPGGGSAPYHSGSPQGVMCSKWPSLTTLLEQFPSDSGPVSTFLQRAQLAPITQLIDGLMCLPSVRPGPRSGSSGRREACPHHSAPCTWGRGCWAPERGCLSA